MKDNDFKIIFDSERHEVDVETLIGCLMHTSNIIQEVNRSLQTEKNIEVKIKALENGITLFYYKTTNGRTFVIEDDEISGTLEIYEEKK